MSKRLTHDDVSVFSVGRVTGPQPQARRRTGKVRPVKDQEDRKTSMLQFRDWTVDENGKDGDFL